MVKLEKSALGAPPVLAHERALPIIPPPDLALHGSWNVAGAVGRRSRAARRRRLGASTPFELTQQQRQGAVEDFGGVAARNGVPRQGLHAPQLVMRVARDGELDLVAFRREGHHGGPWRRRRGGLRDD